MRMLTRVDQVKVKLNSGSFTVYLGLILVLVVLAALRNSFIQDDAFISFRYAHNLIYHHHLGWNAFGQERLEGYTNFLWTMLIAGAIKQGVDPHRH